MVTLSRKHRCQPPNIHKKKLKGTGANRKGPRERQSVRFCSTACQTKLKSSRHFGRGKLKLLKDLTNNLE